MFLFQNDFLGLPDSPEKVTIVGSSALECSIELNWVPRAITRSFAASLIFTINLDQPPITNQLTKNCFSLKVTKAKEKGPISWYFVFYQVQHNMVEVKLSVDRPPFDVAMGSSAGEGYFASRARKRNRKTSHKLASLPVTIFNFFSFIFSSYSFYFPLFKVPTFIHIYSNIVNVLNTTLGFSFFF